MMRKLIGLLVVVILVAVVWLQRERVLAFFSDDDKAAAQTKLEPTPELAEAAELKLQDLKEGRSEEIALHAVELQSLLRYKFIQLLPAFVNSPEVELKDGKIEIKAQVPVDHLPSISELGEAAAFLPDTAEVGLTGSLLPLDSGRVALSIEDVSVARIPLPDRLTPKALKQLGRKNEPGLAANALALPLPPGVASAFLRSDSLVLTSHRVSRSQH
jgi:hypothetical protein